MLVAGLMLVGLFLPFAIPYTYVCNPSSCHPVLSSSDDLLHAWDGWAVLAVVVGLMVAAAAFVARIGRSIAAAAFLALALAGVGLVLYSGVDAVGQVMRFEGYSSLVGIAVPMSPALGGGFRVLLTGALLGVAAAVGMLLAAPPVEWRRGAGAGPWLGALSLAGAVAMFVGLVLPFASVTCWRSFPGFFACPEAMSAVQSNSLVGGMDGWIALLVVVAVAVTAATCAIGRWRWPASIALLALSAAALGLTLFEQAAAATRTLRWSVSMPVGAGPGLYLLVAGAAVSTAAALGMVIAGRRRAAHAAARVQPQTSLTG
jgi:hypothetical protein